MARARILVVEDEAIIARDIERLLLELGYDPVGLASSAEEALDLARVLQPQMVLMDIRLQGGVDGIEAAIALREKFSIASIFLTAFATDAVVERAKLAEPLGYLVKPFDADTLRSTIEIGLHNERVERQLRRSESRYRAVVQSAHDAIVTADRHGTIVDWSPSAATLFGYTQAEAEGQPVTILIPERFLADHLEGMRRLEESGAEPRGECRELVARRRDGSEFPIELSVSRWESAEGWYATAIIRDATVRVQAESDLRLQAEALNATANAMVITDREGTIQWVNPAFSRMTGYSQDDAVGRNPRDLVSSGEQDEDFYQRMWGTLLAGRVWEGELVNRRKDGSHYVEEQTITPVRGAAGQITHFIGVKRDLTESKRLQQQFLQAQRMEVVGRLAGGIAHDFNNLLTVINGTADLALSALPPGHPLRFELETIQQAGDQAARLTRQLLAFSHQQILAPQVVNLSSHLTSASAMLLRLVGSDIDLEISTAPDLDNVVADPSQLEQVLLNLAVNARDAMPEGGKLTIEARNVDLDEAFQARHPGVSPGPHVMLSVSDTGVGMPPEVCSRAFEPFFTTKEIGQGTGLGLATVHGIVQQSGGLVLVDSKPGKGARFRIYLPSAGPGAAVVQVARRDGSPGGTETILLVEDEPTLGDLTARMLRRVGYSVLLATSGAEALEVWRQHRGPLHLLLADVAMRGISGPEVAARIVADQPEIKVLFTSGYAEDELLRKNLSSTRHFLAKPYTGPQLTRKVRDVLDDRMDMD